jgi:hypothetical protein
MCAPKSVGSDAVQDVFLLFFGKQKTLNNGGCHFRAFLCVADFSSRLILTGSPDIVQQGRHLKHVFISFFSRTDPLAQGTDPERVIPVVASF